MLPSYCLFLDNRISLQFAIVWLKSESVSELLSILLSNVPYRPIHSFTYIQRLWELPKRRYSRLALMLSRKLTEHKNIHGWYAEMQQWFESHGISINALPPFQYSLDYPHLNMTKVEKNRVIRNYIINFENKIT